MLVRVFLVSLIFTLPAAAQDRSQWTQPFPPFK